MLQPHCVADSCMVLPVRVDPRVHGGPLLEEPPVEVLILAPLEHHLPQQQHERTPHARLLTSWAAASGAAIITSIIRVATQRMRVPHQLGCKCSSCGFVMATAYQSTT